MKLKSFFNRIPRWIIVLVILAALYFIFNKSVEGFEDKTCYGYYVKSGNYCNGTKKYGYSVPGNGYKDSKCQVLGGNSGQPSRYCMASN